VAPAIEPGWVAPSYGVKAPAPVVSLVADGAPDATFTTVVVPLAAGAEVPAVDVRCADGVTSVEVAARHAIDTVRWSDAREPLALGPLRCAASAGFMRCDERGEPACATAVGVGGGPVWIAWDGVRGMSAGREDGQ
jgi:hypothetical protein